MDGKEPAQLEVGTATIALLADMATYASTAGDAQTLTGKSPSQLVVGTATYSINAGTTSYASDAGILGGGAVNVDLAGNVGIGTTEPGAKLEVVGDVKITGTIEGGSTGCYGIRIWCERHTSNTET